jgi:transcriptional regulator of arginine metabolism
VENEIAEKFTRVLKEAFIGAEVAGSLLVIKTMIGMAMAVAASLDTLGWPEIVGCIAGDDTIFLATHSLEQSRKVKEKLLALIE